MNIFRILPSLFLLLFLGPIITALGRQSERDIYNLVYMTTFSDMDSEIAHWDAFRTDPQWEEMKVMEEYQNNVSRNDTKLLFPTDYSDI